MNFLPELMGADGGGGDSLRILMVVGGWLVTGTIAFGAAWAGAFAAFRYQERRESRHKEKEDFAASQLAVFSLVGQLNWLTSIDGGLDIEKWQANPDAWFQMPAAVVPSIPPPLDLKALAFLLRGETAEVLNVLRNGQWAFDHLAYVLETRASIHKEGFQPQYAANLRTLEGDLTGEAQKAKAAKYVDQDITGSLKSITKELLGSFHESVGLVWGSYELLQDAIATIFEDKVGIAVEIHPKLRRILESADRVANLVV